MKKIKVIFTGGTIGSLVSGNEINTNKNANYLLLQKYGKNLERFDCISPVDMLSENATMKDVLNIARAIKETLKEINIGGIIVTHGSDTLAYTGAYLSMLFSNCTVPIVLVASDYVITEPRANGIINFATAVDMIDNEKILPNVYVAYKNAEEDFVSIHLASRMAEPTPLSSSFHSPLNQRYGYAKEKNIIFENTIVNKTDKSFVINGKMTKKCLFISPYTNLDYSILKDIKCDFVLHSMYHSGTANTGENPQNYVTNIFDFADYCKTNGIDLYLCNINEKDINYNSTNQMLEKNIKFLYNILPNVALAKLNIAYNLINEKEREEFLSSNIAGEIMDGICNENIARKTNNNAMRNMNN